jgi:O-antigen ligase
MVARSPAAPAGPPAGAAEGTRVAGLSEPAPWQTGPEEPGAGALAVVAVCIALAPLVSPKGPGNGGPIDVLVAVGVTTVLLWAVRRRARLCFPYFVPVAAFVAVGLAAAMLSDVPFRSGTAAAQEIFLFLWCAALATVCRTPRALAVLLRTWALSTTVWAGLLIVGVVGGVSLLSGTKHAGTRARLFFDHPNMAGNFFMIAVFLVVASGYPRRRSLRWACCAVLLVATFLSGSNAAMLSLVGGAVVAVFLHLKSRQGFITAIAAVAALAVVLGVGAAYVVPPLVAAAEQSQEPLLRYTLGRSPESADKRGDIFSDQLELYARGNLLGIGPASTKHELGSTFAGVAKEAHNDYLATLVERGPIGVLAVAGLMAAVVARVAGITRRRLSPHLSAAIPVPAALGGACAAFALTALTHEVLHYRWFWTLLGLLAATYLLAQTTREATGAAAGRTAEP